MRGLLNEKDSIEEKERALEGLERPLCEEEGRENLIEAAEFLYITLESLKWPHEPQGWSQEVQQQLQEKYELADPLKWLQEAHEMPNTLKTLGWPQQTPEYFQQVTEWLPVAQKITDDLVETQLEKAHEAFDEFMETPEYNKWLQEPQNWPEGMQDAVHTPKNPLTKKEWFQQIQDERKDPLGRPLKYEEWVQLTQVDQEKPLDAP